MYDPKKLVPGYDRLFCLGCEDALGFDGGSAGRWVLRRAGRWFLVSQWSDAYGELTGSQEEEIDSSRAQRLIHERHDTLRKETRERIYELFLAKKLLTDCFEP